MTEDVRAIWEANAPAAAARGLLTARTADVFGALCFGVAMDARLVEKLGQERDGRARRTIRRLRRRMQELTRSCAWSLGLIALERVATVPHGPRGGDVEIEEWIRNPKPQASAPGGRTP